MMLMTMTIDREVRVVERLAPRREVVGDDASRRTHDDSRQQPDQRVGGHGRTVAPEPDDDGERSPTMTATTSVKQNTRRVMSGVSSSRVCSSPWSSASLGQQHRADDLRDHPHALAELDRDVVHTRGRGTEHQVHEEEVDPVVHERGHRTEVLLPAVADSMVPVRPPVLANLALGSLPQVRDECNRGEEPARAPGRAGTRPEPSRRPRGERG